MEMISWAEIALRLVLAAVFGAVIGLERERKNWVAGLRTHMLVCVGSALAMMVSSFGFMDILGTPNVTLDPSRVAAQVISGIGFLGAGTILFLRQGVVRGLTTAAGLWTVASIGLATGGGMYFAAAAATVLAVTILWLIQPFEKKFAERFKRKSLKIVLSGKSKSLEVISTSFHTEGLKVDSCVVDKSKDDYIVTISFKKVNKKKLSELMGYLHNDVGVKEIVWVD